MFDNDILEQVENDRVERFLPQPVYHCDKTYYHKLFDQLPYINRKKILSSIIEVKKKLDTYIRGIILRHLQAQNFMSEI